MILDGSEVALQVQQEHMNRGNAYVALGPGCVVEIESMYTVPVKVPVATRDDGEDDSDEAVEFGMIFDGMV